MPASVELACDVERRLAAHRRQQRVGPLAAEHARDPFEVERLEVGRVGEAGVGHDRRRVRVDDDRPVALLAQHLERLAARVVELAGLTDHDRARPDQADRRDVVTPRHGAPPRPSSDRGSATRRAAPGPPPGGTAPTARAARGSRGPRRCRRRATRASRPVAPQGSTAKPWFWLVTSTRRVARSITGWFAPRWPNGSLKVARPVASASSWWPRQIPSTGTRPSSSRTVAISSYERLRVAGAVREHDAVVRGERVGVDVVREDRRPRRRAAASRRRIERLAP